MLCSRSSIHRFCHLPRLCSHWTYPLHIGELAGIAFELSSGARSVFLITSKLTVLSEFHAPHTSFSISNVRIGRSAKDQNQNQDRNHAVSLSNP